METLMMLLGITDSSQDELLRFLLDDAENLIKGYCKISSVPDELKTVVCAVAAEMYRRKGYGDVEAPKELKSVTEGERKVDFADNETETDVLAGFYKRLEPFRKKRGRVPSDIGDD